MGIEANPEGCSDRLRDETTNLGDELLRAGEKSPARFSFVQDGKIGNGWRIEKLARQLSSVMKNPLLPERLYNAITDELADTDADSPEYILAQMRGMRRAEPLEDD